MDNQGVANTEQLNEETRVDTNQDDYTNYHDTGKWSQSLSQMTPPAQEIKPCVLESTITAGEDKGKEVSHRDTQVLSAEEIDIQKEETGEEEPVVLQLRSGPTYTIPVTVNKVKVSAVVDTAAQVTLISDKVLELLDPQPIKIKDISLQTAGREMKMKGHVVGPVEIHLGNKICSENVYVAPIQDEMLLGLDLLKKHCDQIELVSNTLFINGKAIKMEMTDSKADAQMVVIRRTIIPPNSVKLVPCETKAEAENFMFQPKDNLPVLIPRSVHTKDQPIMICAVNVSNSNVTLQAKQSVGRTENVAIVNQQLDLEPAIDTTKAAEVIPNKEEQLVPEHLKEMLQNSKEHLTKAQQAQLTKVVIEYQDVFAKDDFDLGNVTAIEHSIDTGDARPVKQRMRRTPVCFVDEEKANLDKMLNAKVVEPSTSKWASAPVLIRKRDGQVRWCVDYRALNAVTVKDVYPLPLLDECMDTLAGSTCFSKLDANSAYWQVPIKNSDRKKTAFITKYGLFQFVRMGFGLCNAPATYSRIMNLVLRGLNWNTVLAFLDDIIVMGKNFDDHLVNLEDVLKKFRDYGLKLKPRKCELCKPKVKFLGRWVGEEGLQLDEQNIKDVKNWPQPTTTKHVEQFVGLLNYHRSFIKDYARLAVPLYEITGKQRFRWNKEKERAFQQIKKALTEAPVLAWPNRHDTFILDTDASDVAIGAVVSQLQNGQERVIAYASFGLSPEQRRYCTTRKELLAVIRFTRQFRHYLLGRPFVVRTDHSSLTWLLNFKEPQGQIARWLEELSQYDMIVTHRPGKKHLNADCMSRRPHPEMGCRDFKLGVKLEDLPCKGCHYCAKAHEDWDEFVTKVDDVVPLAQSARSKRELRQLRKIVLTDQTPECSEISVSSIELVTSSDGCEFFIPSVNEITEVKETDMVDWAKEQRDDRDLTIILKYFQNGKEPTEAELFLESPSSKYMWIDKENFCLQQGVLYRKKKDGGFQRVVPQSLKQKILEVHHDLPSAGHQGPERTKLKIIDKFWWRSVNKDVKRYIAACSICNRNKKTKQTCKSPNDQLPGRCPHGTSSFRFSGPTTEDPTRE